MKNLYFITGTDTGIGKTIITGYLAKRLMRKGYSVITQKFIQTGCNYISEDIEVHRKIMGIDLQDVDKSGLTCPYIFTYPASPHLAAKIDNRDISPVMIANASEELKKKYDIVLLEGTGGLMVPITNDYLLIDYIAEHHLPVIMVVSSKLGSLNHSILSIEACHKRGIEIDKLVYNRFGETDKIIGDDSFAYLTRYVTKLYKNITIEEFRNSEFSVTKRP